MSALLTLIITLMWMIPAILFVIIATAFAFLVNPIFGIFFVLFDIVVFTLSLLVAVGKQMNNKK